MSSDKDFTLVRKCIEDELYREYEFDEVRQNKDGNLVRTGKRIVYKIDNPVFLYLRPGGTTHRIVDDLGVAHCVPSIGIMGCVVRWRNKEGVEPVNF